MEILEEKMKERRKFLCLFLGVDNHMNFIKYPNNVHMPKYTYSTK